MHLHQLPVEILQEIAFGVRVLSSVDVVALVQTCTWIHFAVLGDVGSPNEYDLCQLRALMGVSKCVEMGWWRSAGLALRKRVSCPSQNNQYAIRYASYFGQTELVAMLSSIAVVDPSVESNFALRWACRNGHVGVVKILMQHSRINPNDVFPHIFRLAARNGHTQILRLLLEDQRLHPSERSTSALQLAAVYGHVDTVALLLSDSRFDPAIRSNRIIELVLSNARNQVFGTRLRQRWIAVAFLIKADLRVRSMR